MGGTLGANVMKDHNVVFDYDNHLVGFVDGVCDFHADSKGPDSGSAGAKVRTSISAAVVSAPLPPRCACMPTSRPRTSHRVHFASSALWWACMCAFVWFMLFLWMCHCRCDGVKPRSAMRFHDGCCKGLAAMYFRHSWLVDVRRITSSSKISLYKASGLRGAATPLVLRLSLVMVAYVVGQKLTKWPAVRTR